LNRADGLGSSRSGADEIRTRDQSQDGESSRLVIPKMLLAGADQVIE
jgi:hypothetical protein